MIDEYADIIDEPNAGGLSFVDADVALWDYHPQNNYQGDFFQTVKYTGDFDGVIDRMKNFIRHRVVEGDPNEGSAEPGLSEICDDPAIPNTPVITFVGDSNYPRNNLRFQTSAFSDPQSSGTFAAMKWRIAEVEPWSQLHTQEQEKDVSLIHNVLDREGRYEINAVWESEELSEFNSSIQIPTNVVKAGSTYRIRCRMKDNTGRWSHWSEPVQFLAGESTAGNVLSDLRITELMYNPADRDAASGEPAVDNDNFEFIELQNIGAETIDLDMVSFTDGIDFTFDKFELLTREYVVIVRDRDAFESRYGSAVNIAGEYTGRLNNDGERIMLEDAIGRVILDFDYEDNWYDNTDGDGFSLAIIDPTNPDPNSWGKRDSWCASEYAGGSPGS